MEKLKAWRTPIVIIGLIVVSGLLTATWSGIRDAFFEANSGSNASVPEVAKEDPPVMIDIDTTFPTLAPDYFFGIDAIQNLDDTEVSPLVILGILAAVVVGGIVAVGLLIMLIVRLGDRTMRNLKEDEGYVAAQKAIAQEAKSYVKDNKTAKPAKPKPTGVMPRWSTISTILVAGFMGYMLGTVLSSTLTPHASGNGVANAFGLVALVATAAVVRPTNILTVDETDYNRTPWGMIWVILSGALILGLGLGFTFAVVNGQDPFPFLDGAWWQENVIVPLTS